MRFGFPFVHFDNITNFEVHVRIRMHLDSKNIEVISEKSWRIKRTTCPRERTNNKLKLSGNKSTNFKCPARALACTAEFSFILFNLDEIFQNVYSVFHLPLGALLLWEILLLHFYCQSGHVNIRFLRREAILVHKSTLVKYWSIAIGTYFTSVFPHDTVYISRNTHKTSDWERCSMKVFRHAERLLYINW